MSGQSAAQSALGHAAPSHFARPDAKAPVIPIKARTAAPVAIKAFCFIVIESSRAERLSALEGVVANRESVTCGDTNRTLASSPD